MMRLCIGHLAIPHISYESALAMTACKIGQQMPMKEISFIPAFIFKLKWLKEEKMRITA